MEESPKKGTEDKEGKANLHILLEDSDGNEIEISGSPQLLVRYFRHIFIFLAGAGSVLCLLKWVLSK